MHEANAVKDTVYALVISAPEGNLDVWTVTFGATSRILNNSCMNCEPIYGL